MLYDPIIRMKDGVYLINMARSKIANMKALVCLAKTKNICGVLNDVRALESGSANYSGRTMPRNHIIQGRI